MQVSKEQVMPLAGMRAIVRGDSETARTCARQLRFLGAETSGESQAPSQLAAEIVVSDPLDSNPLRCQVSWAAHPDDHRIVDEFTAQAVCGVMHVNGRKTGRPTPLGVEYCGIVAGIAATQAILAGLFARRRGIPIHEASTSVAHATLMTLSQYLGAATADDAKVMDIQPGGPPFRSADGVLFHPEFTSGGAWADFWLSLGASGRAASAGWRAWSLLPVTATAALPDELVACMARHTLSELRQVATSVGASICPVRTLADRAADIGLASGKPIPAPWMITAVGALPRPAPPRNAVGDSLPLAGLQVVDITRRIQGPLSGRQLSLLGAAVCHVEPVGGDPFRDVPPAVGDCGVIVHSFVDGKEVVEFDLRDPAHRPGLRELTDAADVFLHNWAPGKAEGLQLTAADLRSTNPDLLYAVASGWGGQLGARPPAGIEWVVQAHTGVGQALLPPDSPPGYSLMTPVDAIGAMINAQAILAALLVRQADGRICDVESSLLTASTVLTTTELERAAAGLPQLPGPCVDIEDLPVTTDLATLGDDPYLAGCTSWNGCLTVSAPWSFSTG